jgi:chemotaxis protein MotB
LAEKGTVMARRKEAHGGGHGWFVTFADLMGLLVSFFVMLVAFSNQDAKKMQAVAGSMRDAFGVQNNVRNSGLLESEGLVTRDKLRNAAHIRPEDSSVTPTSDEQGSSFEKDQAFAQAAMSLRQALQDMPELTEASKHIMIEERREGLNIEIVDQDGSSMFPEGSREPYESARKLFKKLAGPLKAAPYRISITGHTSAPRSSPPAGYGSWNLSVDRANTVRQILEEEGYPSANIYNVAGRADTDPLFPEDRSLTPNRRVTITLVHEAPPVPVDLQP